MGKKPWWLKVHVNPLFFLLAIVYVIAGRGREMGIAFLAVSLHELTHAVVADSYGLDVEKIELWPFGGMATISGLATEDPYLEAMVAVVGPLQNFGLAALAWVLARFLPAHSSLVNYFIEVNLALGALNLFPIAPLDGGRLARLYLARRIGYEEAERRVRLWGVRSAQVLFVITILSFVVGKPLISLGIFSGFLYWGALVTNRNAPYLIIRDMEVRPWRFGLRPIWAVDDLAVRDDTPLRRVLKVMRPYKYHRVVVLDKELRRLGILYEEALLEALREKGPDVPVGDLLSAR